MAEYSSYISGWYGAIGLQSFIYDGAGYCNLSVISMNTSYNLIGRTVYFTVKGEQENIKKFLKVVVSSIESYNKI